MIENNPRYKHDPKTGKFAKFPNPKRNRVYLTDDEWSLIQRLRRGVKK